MTDIEYPVEMPPPATAGKRNPHYDKVDAVLREQPGVWRKVVAVTDKKDAQRWRQAGQRKGWSVKQRRSETGWDVYATIVESE
jgi:hypothetical protein